MDLSSMLAREDFFPLFFATLKDYYKEVYDQEIEMDFADRKNCNLVIKPKLSATTSPYLSEKARKFFYAEWNVRNSLIKYVVAKWMVFCLTRTGKLLSSYRFRMTPDVLATKDLVIAPNNRSIRVFDYSNGTVGCMIKKGFTDKYFSNQIAFRKTYSYDFMVPMLRYGDTWFVEPILEGHPLARVTDEKAYEKGMKDALDGIKLLADDTREQIDADTYISNLYVKIASLIKRAESDKQIKTAKQAIQIADECVTATKNKFKILPLCMSHGDFQGGNIWVDDMGKTLLYDWETAGKRSIWYDSAVLAYSLRRHYGWGELSKINMPKMLLNCDTEKNRTENEYRAIKSILLMEDLIFYLEDMLELPENWGREIFDGAVERVSQIKI